MYRELVYPKPGQRKGKTNRRESVHTGNRDSNPPGGDLAAARQAF